MKFWYKIHKKPRGNYRPCVEFGITISAEDVRLNPRIERIYLSTDPTLRVEDGSVVIDCSQLKTTGEPWKLYRYPQRGQDVHSEVMLVAHNGYYHMPDNLECRFFAPWMPGANPDYSPIVDVLLAVRDVFTKMLREGSLSGESEEISGDMSPSARGNSIEWIGTGTSRVKSELKTSKSSDGRCEVVRNIVIRPD